MHQSQNMLFNYMINLICSAHISYTFGDSFPMQNLCGTHLNQSVQSDSEPDQLPLYFAKIRQNPLTCY